MTKAGTLSWCTCQTITFQRIKDLVVNLSFLIIVFKYTWGKSLKNENGQTKLDEFSEIKTKSKGKPDLIRRDWGAEFYKSVFQNFLNHRKIRDYSRFSDKGHSIVERVVGTIRNSIEKSVVDIRKTKRWLAKQTTHSVKSV